MKAKTMQLKSIEMMGRQNLVLAGQLFDGKVQLGDRGLSQMTLVGDFIVLRFDNGNARIISTQGVAMEPENAADIETLLFKPQVTVKAK